LWKKENISKDDQQTLMKENMKEYMHICKILWRMLVASIKMKEEDFAFYLNLESLKEDWNEYHSHIFKQRKTLYCFDKKWLFKMNKRKSFESSNFKSDSKISVKRCDLQTWLFKKIYHKWRIKEQRNCRNADQEI